MHKVKFQTKILNFQEKIVILGEFHSVLLKCWLQIVKSGNSNPELTSFFIVYFTIDAGRALFYFARTHYAMM